MGIIYETERQFEGRDWSLELWQRKNGQFLRLTEAVNKGVGLCQVSSQRVRSRRPRFHRKIGFTVVKFRHDSPPHFSATTLDGRRNNGNHCEPSICRCRSCLPPVQSTPNRAPKHDMGAGTSWTTGCLLGMLLLRAPPLLSSTVRQSYR